MKIDINEISKFKLEPGEVLVLTMEGKISREHLDKITSYLKPTFPNNAVLVIPDYVKISKITQ